MAISVKRLSICLEKPLMDSHADVTKWLKNKTALSEKLIKRWLNSHKATKTTTFGTFYAKANMLLLDSKQKLTFKPTKHVSIAESFVHRLSAISGDRHFYLIDLDIAEKEGWGTIDRNMSYSDILNMFTVNPDPHMEDSSVESEQSVNAAFVLSHNCNMLICQGKYLAGVTQLREDLLKHPHFCSIANGLGEVERAIDGTRDIGSAIGLQTLVLPRSGAESQLYTVVLCGRKDLFNLCSPIEGLQPGSEPETQSYCLIYKTERGIDTIALRLWIYKKMETALNDETLSKPKVANDPSILSVYWVPDTDIKTDAIPNKPKIHDCHSLFGYHAHSWNAFKEEADLGVFASTVHRLIEELPTDENQSPCLQTQIEASKEDDKLVLLLAFDANKLAFLTFDYEQYIVETGVNSFINGVRFILMAFANDNVGRGLMLKAMHEFVAVRTQHGQDGKCSTSPIEHLVDASYVTSLGFNCNEMLQAIWELVHFKGAGEFSAGLEKLSCPVLSAYVDEMMQCITVADLIACKLKGSAQEQVCELIQRKFKWNEYFQWVLKNYPEVKANYWRE